ncbi:MAG: hypothetical protein M1132_10665 [Chloroflexi bacterium]|nr:hypothetical protein [Chloroflexota bacterium]
MTRGPAIANRRADAHRQLGDLLSLVHARKPTMDEKEAEDLILRETMAVKRARARKRLPPERRGQGN